MLEKLKQWMGLDCVLVDVEGLREWKNRVETFVDEDERMDIVDRIRRAWELADKRDENLDTIYYYVIDLGVENGL
jgi:hypothetical protein